MIMLIMSVGISDSNKDLRITCIYHKLQLTLKWMRTVQRGMNLVLVSYFENPWND
jgi:hypothetical protein